ncbi:OsmC family protein [Halolamina salifodinae]|uniref:Putative OsmC-like protein n=1 Tax=Halolamina salifodinae TaxID=1202767 RepID=A0A8T4GR62_9EURY|nr:OsmC family protein [Halolamina salifodinae]MBP1985641.1 putative OsmC-like protein [Halolamina salifodinae]
MSKQVTTVSESGYESTTEIRDFSVDIDPGGESAPDTLESLLASYGACYVPALRVGAQQRDVGDLGEIELSITGDLNDDDKLAAIQFDIAVEADVSEEAGQEAIDRAFDLCKVHDALKTDLHAETTFEGGAF